MATVHDLIPFLFPIYLWPKRSVVKIGYRLAARKARHIIAVSNQTAADIQRILGVSPERITAIYSGVSEETFYPGGGAAEAEYLRKQYGVICPYVLTASARNWRVKNLSGTFEALVLARHKLEVGFQTVVFGPSDGIDAVSSSDSCRQLNPLTLGHIPARDLGMLYRNARLFITLSLYEGFGFPILEAMSCGCPVIASNGGSLAEVAAAGGQTFPALATDKVANSVADLLRSEEEWTRWRNRALARAAAFSWKKTAEATASVYRRVCL